MKHLGDIRNIRGDSVPSVDAVIGGSPCQDLSVAGKRAGLAGERSGLFTEQIRVVKEMRDESRKLGNSGDSVRPRFMVWENVPGALSSNGGDDFRAVLEETAHVVCQDAVIPGPPKGKWTNSGAIVGDGWSIAWRIHDAQFWGVPQRRRRIALVADFGGQSAPEVLFERTGLSGYSEKIGESQKGNSAETQGCTDTSGGGKSGESLMQDVGESFGAGNYVLNDQGGKSLYVTEDVAGTLRAQEHGHQPLVCNREIRPEDSQPETQRGCAFEESLYDHHMRDARVKGPLEVCPTVTQMYGTGGYNTPLVMSTGQSNAEIGTDLCPTLNADHENPVLFSNTANSSGNAGDCYSIQGSLIGRSDKNGPQGTGVNEDVCFTLNGTDRHAVCRSSGPETESPSADDTFPIPASGRETGTMNSPAAHCEKREENFGVTGTLRTHLGGGFPVNCRNVVRVDRTVRRLTPLECERLQGFPDGWTDIGEWVDSGGKKHRSSDSARYRALGNSIALPFWIWLCGRISALYDRPATMASLFDGIGGFPLVWERVNGRGSCLWASEVEEFCIAVTKKRFPEDCGEIPDSPPLPHTESNYFFACGERKVEK